MIKKKIRGMFTLNLLVKKSTAPWFPVAEKVNREYPQTSDNIRTFEVIGCLRVWLLQTHSLYIVMEKEFGNVQSPS